jgi:AcrR family transcriptional regulator
MKSPRLFQVSDNTATKRVRRSADDTRRLVIDAAVSWIEENGSANLKIVDIARVCGVSEVLIYRYFSDRQGVLTAALVELWERYMIEPLDQARAMIENLPDDAFTPELLVKLGIRPNLEVERRRRWARLQVLAASPENPELAQLIRETQNRINREHESLIDLIRTRMPGRHVPSARVMRMLNQNVMFGFLLEDLTDNPVSQDELDEFLLEFFERMYEPHLD